MLLCSPSAQRVAADVHRENDRVGLAPDRFARQAGLHYAHDDKPGIGRVRTSRGFRFVDAQGRALSDPTTVARCEALVIPPAWTKVWICPDPRGHIQATGRDARGRKQYKYHAQWRASRDENKFHRMAEFGRVLPKIRRKVGAQLREPGLSREKVLAAVVRLLELSAVRVGNEEYAAQNHSYGLTTLRNRHARVSGEILHLQFRGKGGKEHRIDIQHPQLARIVRKCQHLPGQHLFEYVEAGKVRPITSSDVNEYLGQISGGDFTAKDFRTWKGTLLASSYLEKAGMGLSKTKCRRVVVEAIKQVALQLGNTPAICKKSYIHPLVIDCYLQGKLTIQNHGRKSFPIHLRGHFHQDELSLLVFLEQNSHADALRGFKEETKRRTGKRV